VLIKKLVSSGITLNNLLDFQILLETGYPAFYDLTKFLLNGTKTINIKSVESKRFLQ
jgi:hypothetical protein